jgi:hypothetical protein
MSEIILYVDPGDYEGLLNADITINEFLENVLNESDYDDPDSGNRGDLISQLLRNYSDEGGSPQIDDFSIYDASIDIKSGKGSFDVCFLVSYYFTCSDMDSHYDGTDNVKFILNPNDSSMTLNFQDYEVRTTKEEF